MEKTFFFRMFHHRARSKVCLHVAECKRNKIAQTEGVLVTDLSGRDVFLDITQLWGVIIVQLLDVVVPGKPRYSSTGRGAGFVLHFNWRIDIHWPSNGECLGLGIERSVDTVQACTVNITLLSFTNPQISMPIVPIFFFC